MGVAACVFGQHVPDSIPGAKIGPTGSQWHHFDGEFAAGAVFHDGVVDRISGDGGEFGFSWADESRINCAFVPSLLDGLGDVGAELLERFKPDRGLEDEHAGVPVVTAFVEVGLGGGGVGLFDKSPYHQRRLLVLSDLGLNIAVACFRMGRGYAQDDYAAGGGFAYGELHGATERCLICNGLVGGGDDENRVGAVFEGGQCGERQRWGGVAADGLKQAGTERDAGLA